MSMSSVRLRASNARWAGLHVASSVLCSLAFAACAAGPGPEAAAAPVPDTVVVTDTVRVEVESAASAELEQRAARLQLELLDRDAQLEELQRRVDAAYQEVVRTMAKLQTQASRAEAASGIAEAEIAVRDLSSVTGGQASAEIAQAQQLLEMSGAEFNQDNFAGALYLATQARVLADGVGIQLRGTAGQTMLPGEVLFARSVPLQTRSRSNVRSGPGLNFEILFTLDQGVALVGRSHTDQWVRVADDRGRTGWIYLNLVEPRQ